MTLLFQCQSCVITEDKFTDFVVLVIRTWKLDLLPEKWFTRLLACCREGVRVLWAGFDTRLFFKVINPPRFLIPQLFADHFLQNRPKNKGVGLRSSDLLATNFLFLSPASLISQNRWNQNRPPAPPPNHHHYLLPLLLLLLPSFTLSIYITLLREQAGSRDSCSLCVHACTPLTCVCASVRVRACVRAHRGF